MIKLFIYNKESPQSQKAYRALMEAGVDIKTIEVTGKNVANRLKVIGVTHVPTLYLRDKRNVKMLVGDEILEFLQPEEEEFSDIEQSYTPPRQKPKSKKNVARVKKKSVESSEINSELDSDIGSEIVSEINSDDSEIEQIEIGEGSEIGSDGDVELENDKGKLNPKAVMRMMQTQNAQAQGLD